jgi:hypothetical protein
LWGEKFVRHFDSLRKYYFVEAKPM